MKIREMTNGIFVIPKLSKCTYNKLFCILWGYLNGNNLLSVCILENQNYVFVTFAILKSLTK